VRRHLPVPRQSPQLDAPQFRLVCWVSGAPQGRLADPCWRAEV